MSFDDDYDEDGYESWTFGDSDTEGVIRHAMSQDGVVPCCGKTYNQIGTDWMTSDPSRVNCPAASRP